MNRDELLRQWKKDADTQQSLAQLDVLLKSLCDVMASELFKGGEVSLPSMGKLSAVHTKARDGRNPKTGEKLHIPAKLRVVFKPSKVFRELLN